MNENLENFLNKNAINLEKLLDIVYNYILLSSFNILFNFLEKDNNKQILKKKLRAAVDKNDELCVIRTLISENLDVTFSKEEEKYLLELIKAYLNKSSRRVTINKETKELLSKKQNGKCKICEENIKIEDHLDHIIPFKFVGDELPENYQMLCKRCNLLKNDSIIFLFEFFFQKKFKK